LGDVGEFSAPGDACTYHAVRGKSMPFERVFAEGVHGSEVPVREVEAKMKQMQDA
jgi:hypothetical protein